MCDFHGSVQISTVPFKDHPLRNLPNLIQAVQTGTYERRPDMDEITIAGLEMGCAMFRSKVAMWDEAHNQKPGDPDYVPYGDREASRARDKKRKERTL